MKRTERTALRAKRREPKCNGAAAERKQNAEFQVAKQPDGPDVFPDLHQDAGAANVKLCLSATRTWPSRPSEDTVCSFDNDTTR